MRLLLRGNTSKFSLNKDLIGDDIIPPYCAGGMGRDESTRS